jgi:squalene cyclase
MRNLTLPQTQLQAQQPARDAQRDAPDAARLLDEARAAVRAERARQCRAQAWGIAFIIDACDDADTAAAWLAERAALLATADALETGGVE